MAPEAVATDVAEQIWQRNANLWKPDDAAHAKVIANRLGWLDVIDTMRNSVGRLGDLAAATSRAGVSDVVLLGMGGSSLCPEVFRSTFGSIAGHPTLHVLDTTDPTAIISVTQSIDVAATWFIVASKSGTTLETLSHYAHFRQETEKAVGDRAGEHFIAISDPASPLVDLARKNSFREIFENPPDIGGRYSALSFFGLVPAALMGIDVERLLDRASSMRASCWPGGAYNPGLELGTAIATRHSEGRDKLTIACSPSISAFSLWAEQLIAESTGKEGKGVIPIGDEPVGSPGVYGSDRFFVSLSVGNDPTFDNQMSDLENGGQPVMRLHLADHYDLGAEFFRWEFAVAVAGAALQIDPFDEPNVKESKDNTNRVLGDYEKTKQLATESTAADGDLAEFLGRAKPGDYVAIMAYVTPTEANHSALQKLRVQIRDHLKNATTLGYGPRFLHSTGQLHKGGPNTGLFIQITQNDHTDVSIPGKPFGFSTLKQAQAIGDMESLQSHDRRVIHFNAGDDVAGGVAAILEAYST